MKSIWDLILMMLTTWFHMKPYLPGEQRQILLLYLCSMNSPTILLRL